MEGFRIISKIYYKGGSGAKGSESGKTGSEPPEFGEGANGSVISGTLSCVVGTGANGSADAASPAKGSVVGGAESIEPPSVITSILWALGSDSP
jgi:hypothetical protein